MPHRWFIRLLAGWLALSAGSASCAEPAVPVYSLHIVPQFPGLVIHQTWWPIATYLSRETGARFEVKISPSIPEFERSMLAGEADFVYLNPYHQVMAHRAQGYIPLVRDRRHLLNGVLVVAANSPYRSVKDLAGKNIVFPAPNAFGASLFMRAQLAEKEGVAFRAAYVGTHSNVYRQVAMGLASAGGGIQSTLEQEPEGLRSRLRVLYQTPSTPSHPLSAHPRVPEKVRHAVADALLRLRYAEGGEALLEAIRMPDPMRSTYDRDYAPLESLGLDRYVVLEKEGQRQ